MAASRPRALPSAVCVRECSAGAVQRTHSAHKEWIKVSCAEGGKHETSQRAAKHVWKKACSEATDAGRRTPPQPMRSLRSRALMAAWSSSVSCE